MKLSFICNKCKRIFTLDKKEYLKFIEDETKYISCPYDDCRNLNIQSRYYDIEKTMKRKAVGEICK